MECGLILEGGGLRGIYTSGVLEFFSEKNLEFDIIVGVSMGACNAANYLAKQKYRNKEVNINYVNDKRYINYFFLLKGGELFNSNFIFKTVALELNPFDFTTMKNNKTKFLIGVTNCITGEAEFFEKNNLKKMEEFTKVLKASISLPFIAKAVNYNNNWYMDGGIAEPIPIKELIKRGYEKNVVILTRDKSYRKKKSQMYKIAKLLYPKFPGLLKVLQNRYKNYNMTLDFLENLERQNKVLVIRPSKKLKAGRVERNKNKLYETYNLGLYDAKNNFEKLAEYIRK